MEPIDEPSPPVPPRDPEEWTDDQWLSWLTSTDGDEASEGRHDAETLAQRAANSAVGVVIGQAMMGMARAIYGHHDEELVIVADGNGPAHDDEPFSVHLDFDHPERSSVDFTTKPDRPE